MIDVKVRVSCSGENEQEETSISFGNPEFPSVGGVKCFIHSTVLITR